MAIIRVTGVGREHVDHDTGHWCNTCRLATGLRVWVACSHQAKMHLQVALVCTECSGSDITVDPDVPLG